MTTNPRASWYLQTDTQLLAQCELDTYRASGPGGQKRNKTSSAVRLRHLPTGLIVIAEESRSQHENKAKAILRLRRAFMLQLRDPAPDLADWFAVVVDGQCRVGAKQPTFWPAAAIALDLLTTHEGQVSTAAAVLGLSTGQLSSFLETHPKLWQTANEIRTAFGQKPLR